MRVGVKGFCLSVLAVAFGACAGELSERERVDARIQYDLGVEQLSKSDLTGALQSFTRSESLDPSFPDLHNAIGLVYFAMKRYDDAEKHFKQALELKPKWSEAHNNMGIVLSTKGEYDRAVEHFKIALNDVLYDSPSHAEGNMGYALYRKGDRVAAIKHIKNATLVNPQFCRGFLWLGEIHQEGNELREAERYLDRFIERCVLDSNLKVSIDAYSKSEAYMRLGQVTLAAGNSQRSRSAFQQCMSIGRDTPWYEVCDDAVRKLPAVTQ